MSSPVRTLIVDDERLARTQLRKMLAAHPEVEVVGEAADADQALALIRTTSPEALFLDVQMPRKSGFDLLKELEEPLRVVFVTAFDAHAVRAFEVNALDYLLKPVVAARLAHAVEKLVGAAPVPPSEGDPEELRPLQYDDRLFVTLGRRPQFLRVSDIACVVAADDYTELRTRSGESALVLQPLHVWERRLPQQQFVRIHRSTLVNFDAILNLEEEPQGGYRVSVAGGAEPLTMSRRFASALKQRLR